MIGLPSDECYVHFSQSGGMPHQQTRERQQKSLPIDQRFGTFKDNYREKRLTRPNWTEILDSKSWSNLRTNPAASAF